MTSIEWTDATWNPMTGCTKVSPGCAHCYAEKIAPRTFGGRPFTDVRFHQERLDRPRRWRKPRRVFVNSMSDLFHEDIPIDQILDVMRVIYQTPRHTFQVLTKRPERMREVMNHPLLGDILSTPPPNLWLGVSVENQEMADRRIPILLDTPAACLFLSVEPLLAQTYIPMPGIDWVIVGGESGPKARPCSLEWVRSIVAQCAAAGVPCFVKQLGARPMHTSLTDARKGPLQIRDRKGGDPAEWPPELRVREWPTMPATTAPGR